MQEVGGSSPPREIRACSSMVRALVLHTRSCRFESDLAQSACFVKLLDEASSMGEGLGLTPITTCVRPP